MPPRRDNDKFAQDDSDSDISIDDDADVGRTLRAKGKQPAHGASEMERAKASQKTLYTLSPCMHDTQAYTWEASYTRSWETVQEDEAGSLQSSVDDWMARGRRRRLLAPTTAIRRTIIRHLVLLLDLSASMMDRDMRPTRFDLMLQYAREFVAEWFDQNPLGQIGVVGMRAGVGERIGEMSGNPQDVLKSIADRHRLEPTGEPSLQNSIEMARSSMSHLPIHSSREIIVLFGSLTTCDPGNIHDTLDACVKAKIRISVVALAAEMKICRDLCEKTGGQFGVALNEGHFRDLLFELIPPPAQQALARPVAANPSADLMIMGFPTRLPDTSPPSLCVSSAHDVLAKVCDVPTDCDICGLMIVSSPHLARSYHHLLSEDQIHPGSSPSCHACARPFPPPQTAAHTSEGLSPLGRYRCPDCNYDFCSECDVFVHDVIHCCPGCGK
ncbi:Ssl1-like-domain-containing protein [Lyophyllum atratum]|nr:Ssl1-like-domain-containing protein [Lyophyllum atratum]